MREKSEIVLEVAMNPVYMKACFTIAAGNDLHKDLFQEAVLVLLEYDPVKLADKYERGHFRYFFVRILLNLYKSRHSSFYRKYRHNDHLAEFSSKHAVAETEYDSDTDVVIDKIEAQIKKLDPGDADLLFMYLQQGSTRKVHSLIGIPHNTIWYRLGRIKKDIKNNL